MKKHLLVCIIFLLLFSISQFYGEAEQTVSFYAGTGSDSGFVDKNSVSLEWIYTLSAEYFDLVGGARFTSSSADFSFEGKLFKSFLNDAIKFSGGATLHSSFINDEAFLQDSFIIAAVDFSLKPIFTSYGIIGGVGFNNTHVYQLPGIWINEFYPIIRTYIKVDIMDKFCIGASLSNHTFFIYDFWSPKAEFWADVKLSDKFDASGCLTIRYTPNASNENIQIEGMDFKLGVKYEF